MSGDKTQATGRFILPFEEADAIFRRVDERLTMIERVIAQMETERAVSDEKRKHMDGRFNQIDSRLNRIDGHVSRVVWLLIAAILSGFMTFMLRGGMFGV